MKKRNIILMVVVALLSLGVIGRIYLRSMTSWRHT